MSKSILVVLVPMAAALGVMWLQREWSLRRLRLEHWALFRPERDAAKLRRWTQQVLEAFPGLATVPELDRPTFPSNDQQAAGLAAISLAAERFGFPLNEISLQLGQHPHLPMAAGVAEVPSDPWSWKLEGDHIYFVAGTPAPPAPRRIHLAESAFESDDKLAWVAAHEVAHVALAAARLARPGHENEEITDLATVVAGYGPILARLRYVEERYFASGGRLGWRVSKLGTLSQPAIAFVRELRALPKGSQASSSPAA